MKCKAAPRFLGDRSPPGRVPRRRSAADADDLDAVQATEAVEEVGDAAGLRGDPVAPAEDAEVVLRDQLDGLRGDTGHGRHGQLGAHQVLVDDEAEHGGDDERELGAEQLEPEGDAGRGLAIGGLDLAVEVVQAGDGRGEHVVGDLLEEVVHAQTEVLALGDRTFHDQRGRDGALVEGHRHGTLHDFLSPS